MQQSRSSRAVSFPGLTTHRPGRPWRAALRWLGFGALLAALAGPCAAKEWVYVARTGDNLWDLAVEYLVSMRYWGRFRTLNNVPNPRQMPPGTEVRFPVEWLRVESAPVLVVEEAGAVTVERSGGAGAQPVAVGERLGSGDRLRTGPDSSVLLRFADGSELLVRPDSDVLLDDLGRYGQSGMIDSRARLERGRVEASVPAFAAPRPRFEISTPSASAVVRGTDFRVSSETSPPLARTEVLDGAVRVQGAGRPLTVSAGAGTVIRQGEAPERPRPLLPAPDLGALESRFERIQLRIGWPPVTDAAAYQVQITRLDGTATLLLDETVPGPRVTLPDLPDGTYALKVRSVDADGLEGTDGRHEFELDARPEPPVAMEPRPDRKVRVARPGFRWTVPADAQAYRFQLAADAGFGSLLMERDALESAQIDSDLDLDEGDYYWRIATVAAGGDLGPFGDVQTFTLRLAPPAPDAEAEVDDESIALRWQAARPGQTYEIEMADDEAFSKEVRVEATAEPLLSMVPPKKNFWFRVRTIDVDGYAGPYGTPQRVDVPGGDPWWVLLLPLLILIAL